MTAEEIELRHIMLKRSDEELLTIVRVEAGDYRHEAINIAIEELTRRGIPFSSASQLPFFSTSQISFPSEVQIAEYRSPFGELKGVGGFLLLLCIRFTIISPLFTIIVLFYAISTSKKIADEFAQTPKITVVGVAIGCLVYIVPEIFGVYAGVTLWAIRKRAVRLAKIATLIFIGVNILNIIVFLFLGQTSSLLESKFSLVKANAQDPALWWEVARLGGNVMWYAYLSKSKRIKNTYGEQKTLDLPDKSNLTLLSANGF